MKEGGLGLRSLGDIQKALHMRFAWSLFQGNSLWANFFKAKYVGNRPWSLIGNNKGSRFWRMIANCIPLLLNNSKWKIKEGDLFFWYDNWRDNGPLINEMEITGPPFLKVKDCRLSEFWDVELLEELVGQDKVDEIVIALAGLKNGKDVLIWTPTDTGIF